MIPSPDYNMSAYLLAIAEQVERDIIDDYVDGDTPASKMLLSERVIYVDREVSQAAFQKFLRILRQVQQQSKDQMAQYEFRKCVETEYKISIEDKEKKDDGKPSEAPVAQEVKADPEVPAGAPSGSSGDKDRKPRDGGGSKR